MPDYEFGISFRAEDRLDARAVAEALQQMEALLLDVESRLTNKAAVGHWKWADEAITTLKFVISPNGVTPDVIEHTLADVTTGFNAGQSLDASFPESFGPAAIQSVRSILRRLETVEAIVVEATGQPTLEITDAPLPGITRRRTRRVWSSVDGILETMTAKSGLTVAGVREHGTGRFVKLLFSNEEWDSRLQSLWKQRVLVEGRVAYNADGEATSITEVEAINPRETTNLRDFRGMLPELTQGRSPEEHVAKVRGDG